MIIIFLILASSKGENDQLWANARSNLEWISIHKNWQGKLWKFCTFWKSKNRLNREKLQTKTFPIFLRVQTCANLISNQLHISLITLDVCAEEMRKFRKFHFASFWISRKKFIDSKSVSKNLLFSSVLFLDHIRYIESKYSKKNSNKIYNFHLNSSSISNFRKLHDWVDVKNACRLRKSHTTCTRNISVTSSEQQQQNLKLILNFHISHSWSMVDRRMKMQCCVTSQKMWFHNNEMTSMSACPSN